ncbi:DUF3461 family protein [Motiliproteus sp. MSK22-1]|uniref:DUF3461 family protein n=1 Tax=Motiliproteus sp. MSK22-1 TaxID=1897630 RepID=UPI000977D0BC|nr:DUF3461 family protein [Motiliproteus sp. MSK22-1]OMH31751.1 hypothetical protein BGP75_16660 [Motiliproteus sp. MSK22-1]
MSDYPTLTDMGITSFENVERFSVRREHQADVLKVYYKRPKASLLSRSKKFTFVRARSAVPMQSRGLAGWDQLKDSSPKLQQAIAELTRLTQPETPTVVDQKQQFIENLDHLEKVVQSKISEIRDQIEALK